MTTRVLLAHHGRLVRGALAAVLAQERDIEVVAESAHGDELPDLVRQLEPHIAILDFELPTTATMVRLCEELVPLCVVLLMADRRSAVCRKIDVGRWAPRLGVIAQESPPSVLIEGVRRAAAGELVIDADLARAAVTAGRNPLTERESEVLLLAEAGLTTRDIALKLFLSHGTVRNHLSRVLAKTGARTRIEAIRFAKEAGWI